MSHFPEEKKTRVCNWGFFGFEFNCDSKTMETMELRKKVITRERKIVVNKYEKKDTNH